MFSRDHHTNPTPKLYDRLSDYIAISLASLFSIIILQPLPLNDCSLFFSRRDVRVLVESYKLASDLSADLNENMLVSPMSLSKRLQSPIFIHLRHGQPFSPSPVFSAQA
jgi:hypothetical protein